MQVFVPSNAIAGLGAAGDTVSLHTLLRIREEQPVIYGFPDDASVQLFTMLTGVSGVGPRLGLALLSALDAASLQLAVASGDAAALSAGGNEALEALGGVILELRGKVDAIESDGVAAVSGGDGEVLAALSALGYSAAEAKAAVDAIPEPEGLSVEEKIRLALQQFARR